MARDHFDISKGKNALPNNFDLMIPLISLIQSCGSETV